MKISVIIPVYNEEKYIKECLNSVIKAKPDEVIVVDDGSTDKTAEIIKQLPVRYFYQNHKGAAMARNFGVNKAKGDVVCMIDADMVLDKKYFKEIKKTLKKVPMCDHDEYSLTKNWVSEYFALVKKISIKKPSIARAMYKKIWIPQRELDGYYNDGAQFKRLIEARYEIGMSKAKVWHHENDSFKVMFLMGKSFINSHVFNWKSLFYTLSSLTPIFFFPALYRAIKFRNWKIFFAEWIAKFFMACGIIYGTTKKYFRKLFPPFLSYLLEELKDCNSVLDLGCGKDSLIKHSNIPYKVGVELFRNYLKESRKSEIHDRYILADITKLEIKKRSFDVVIALDVLEHLNKNEGFNLIKKIKKLAIKKVIVYTPNGFLHQEEFHDNPFQIHKSGWTVDELKSLGFEVYGIHGFKFLRKELAEIRFRPKKFWLFISDITQKFTYYFPEYAFQFLAVKNVK